MENNTGSRFFVRCIPGDYVLTEELTGVRMSLDRGVSCVMLKLHYMKLIKKIGCMILALALILSLMFTDTNFQSEAASGKWKHNSNGYYYVYANGTRSKKGWKTIGGKTYYFGDSGLMKTGWKKVGGKTYRFDEYGIWIE